MSRVVLLGLASDLADQLTQVLADESHAIVRLQSASNDPLEFEPEVVFISGDTPHFTRDVAALLDTHPRLAVVVVTRLAETSRWLDALEAGARDYCGAPFERVQIRWIMDSVCPRSLVRAA